MSNWWNTRARCWPQRARRFRQHVRCGITELGTVHTVYLISNTSYNILASKSLYYLGQCLMVISRFNATKAYKRKRGASPPRLLISLTYWVTQVGSVRDNESDKGLCHSVKFISFISQRKTSIPLRMSLLSVTGWYAWSSCKICSRKYVVFEDARNVVMHELVVTNLVEEI